MAAFFSGADIYYPDEFLDVFHSLNGAERTIVLPMFDLDHYVAHNDIRSMRPLDHVLTEGLAHWRSPHALIDLRYIHSQRRDLFVPQPSIDQLLHVITANVVDPSPFFPIADYQAVVQDREVHGSLLLHFLNVAAEEDLSPLSYFDPAYYRKLAKDVPANGRGALLHFIRHGDENRIAPSAAFDPLAYEAHYADVTRSMLPPLQHYLRIGRFEGRQVFKFSKFGRTTGQGQPTQEWAFDPDPAVWQDDAVRMRSKIEQSFVAAREAAPIAPIDIDLDAAPLLTGFSVHQNPLVDVIIPFYNEVETTRRCLHALREAMGDIPVNPILVNDGSSEDDTSLAMVKGVTLIRNRENLHYLRSCNRAFAGSTAPYVLLLNNDARLLEGGLQALMDELQSAPDIAAAGPKMVYPSGHLQEAGCAIRADASTAMVGLTQDPALPCFNYARDVGHISAACLLLRRNAIEGDLYDERFVPAYCEDADLSLRLRASGRRIRYVPGATCVHELSVSTGKHSQAARVRQVVVNQQKLQEKWADMLEREGQISSYAFYLPQFHPTEENNLWWGKGFTEWTNVAKAKPSFEGHYQPHLPSDHGYYDLRCGEVMSQQYALAQRYGLNGFIMYYYNFGARRVLDRPLRNLLANEHIDFRFALCWANENWTRHWDGGEKAILLEQQYDDSTLSSVCDDAVLAGRDHRAIQVNGRPLFLVYRPLLFPDAKRFTDMLRDRFVKAGLGDPYLMYVESMEAIHRGVSPQDMGFDACVEFPPQGIGAPYSDQLSVLKAGWEGHVYDYEESVVLACKPSTPGYKRIPAVFPGWDNTARQPLKGTTFVGQSPALFSEYVRKKAEFAYHMLVGEEKMLFINAWNEWAEGTHLEPDVAYGHAWLQALQDGIEAAKYPS
jgi:GT2 family glycosyltransferase